MSELSLKSIRKDKKISQASLAEKLFVPIKTIRSWELMKSIPDINDIKRLANVLKVKEEVIISVFEKKETQVSAKKEKESELYKLLVEIFWECNEAEKFIIFTSIFSMFEVSGVISCDQCVFPFSRVFSQDSFATILSDASKNYIVFTTKNIVEVDPISVDYDIYTFDLVTNCPIFPINKKYSPNIFRQKMRLSFFNR